MKADEKGLTMERMCIACGGSGLAEHVDRTLPPPPCRLCHPEEAALHLALAHETRTIVAARRRDAYQRLRAAIALGSVVPRAATPALLTVLQWCCQGSVHPTRRLMEPIELESAVGRGSTFTLVLPLLDRSLRAG